MIFEECKRAGLQQPMITDERGVVKVTFIRPDLSGHNNGTINDTINDNERLIYNRIVLSPGISAVALANEYSKSIITVKRALKNFGRSKCYRISRL